MKTLIASLFVVSWVSAAGGGHAGSPSDIIHHFVNFGIFFVGIVILFVRVLKPYFIDNSIKVENHLNRAKIQADEIYKKYEEKKEKLYKLEDKIDEFKVNLEQNKKTLKEEIDQDIKNQKERMATDLEQRIRVSEKNLKLDLESYLTHEVVLKTKENFNKSAESFDRKMSTELERVVQ